MLAADALANHIIGNGASRYANVPLVGLLVDQLPQGQVINQLGIPSRRL